MTERGQVRYGSSAIHYRVNRSPRRKKTVEITLDGEVGVLVAAPADASADDIAAIVRKRAPWILRKAPDAMLRVQERSFVSGESLSYLGRQVRMVVNDTGANRAEVRFQYWGFEVNVPRGLDREVRRDTIRRSFARWYRSHALARLTSRVLVWSRLPGLEPAKLLIRDQRQRWASCSADGTLRFNWRVIMAAPALIDYVIVHELVHMVVKSHARQFWARVAAVMPDFEVRRRRLREIGPYLTL